MAYAGILEEGEGTASVRRIPHAAAGAGGVGAAGGALNTGVYNTHKIEFLYTRGVSYAYQYRAG